MTDDPNRLQQNSAKNARIAARDYHEYHIHGLVPRSDEEEEHSALASEDHFRERFGFAALPAARQWFLAFMRQHGLTRYEVRRLSDSGVFDPQRSWVRVRASYTRWLAGWTVVGGASIYGVLLVFGIDALHGDPWRKLLAEVIAMGTFSWIAWGVGQCWVWPYARLNRRQGSPEYR